MKNVQTYRGCRQDQDNGPILRPPQVVSSKAGISSPLFIKLGASFLTPSTAWAPWLQLPPAPEAPTLTHAHPLTPSSEPCSPQMLPRPLQPRGSCPPMSSILSMSTNIREHPLGAQAHDPTGETCPRTCTSLVLHDVTALSLGALFGCK